MSNTIKTVFDLVKQFPDERSCHQYLASQRWDTGEIICPHEDCGHNVCYVFADGLRYKCKKCERLFTAKTNTFMESSKLPTIKWLMAMYLVMHKKGISSVQLGKDLGITQKTAWFVLQRIRWALSNDNESEKLSGTVEIDETFYGGKNKNRHYDKKQKYMMEDGSRTWKDKMPVFGAYERERGRIRANVVDSKTFADIGLAVVRNIEISSTLMTDDWGGYNRLQSLYECKSIDHSKGQYVSGDVTTNRIENFWSHFKRGMHGTYIRVTPKHLNRYVQEFVFRFNHRTFNVQQQIDGIIKSMVCRLTYKELIA